MGHGKDVLDELRNPVRDLRQRIPAVFEAYGSLHAAVFTDGALDGKTKELLGLVASMVLRCDDCITYQTTASRTIWCAAARRR